MEHVIQLHIEKLPEGVYLATSDEVQGLVAQGRRIQETIEIARDVDQTFWSGVGAVGETALVAVRKNHRRQRPGSRSRLAYAPRRTRRNSSMTSSVAPSVIAASAMLKLGK